jgi:hypothetical protein
MVDFSRRFVSILILTLVKTHKKAPIQVEAADSFGFAGACGASQLVSGDSWETAWGRFPAIT